MLRPHNHSHEECNYIVIAKEWGCYESIQGNLENIICKTSFPGFGQKWSYRLHGN